MPTRMSDILERCESVTVWTSETSFIRWDTLCTRCTFRSSMILDKFAVEVFASAMNFCRSYFNVSNFKAPFEASTKLYSNSLKPLAPSASVDVLDEGDFLRWEVDEPSCYVDNLIRNTMRN